MGWEGVFLFLEDEIKCGLLYFTLQGERYAYYRMSFSTFPDLLSLHQLLIKKFELV